MQEKQSGPARAPGSCKIEVREDRVLVNGNDAGLSVLGFRLFMELYRKPGAVRSPLACTMAVWPSMTEPDIAGLNGLLTHIRRHIDRPGFPSHFGIDGNRGAYFDPIARAVGNKMFQSERVSRKGPRGE